MAAEGKGGDDVGLECFDRGMEASAMAAEIIDEVLTKGSEILYDHYLEQRETPFAVSRVFGDVMQVMKLCFLDGDGEPGPGEEIGAPAYFDAGSDSRAPGTELRDTGMWECEDEPEPATIDTWARGAVPTKKVPKKVVEEPPAEPEPGAGRRNTSPRQRVRPIPQRSRVPAAPARASTPPSTAPLERTISPRISLKPAEAPVTSDQAVRARALADMRRKEAEEEERKRKEEAEEKARQESIEKQKRDLWGKKFTLDDKGEVMVVRKVNHARLPPPFENVGLAIGGGEDDAPPPEPAPEPSRRRRPARRREQRPESPATDDVDESVYFQPSLTLQPPLVETMQLAPGVVLREGPSIAQGPPPPEETTHMSRKDFTSHQSMLSSLLHDTAPSAGMLDSLGAAASSGPLNADDPDVAVTLDPAWGENVPTLNEPVSPTQKAKKPSHDQRYKAMGAKPRNPRDRPFVSTTETMSRRAPQVSASGDVLRSSTESPSASAFGSASESFVLPPIPSASTASALNSSPIPSRRRPPSEWGETAARKHAGSLTVSDRAKELLNLGSM